MADDDSDYDFDASSVEGNATQSASATDEPLDVTRHERLTADARRFYGHRNRPPFTQHWCWERREKPRKVIIAPQDGSPPGLHEDPRIGLLIPKAWDRTNFYWILDHESERHIVKGKAGGGYGGGGATYRRCLGFSRNKGIYEDRVLAYTTSYQRLLHRPNAGANESPHSASSRDLSSLDDSVEEANTPMQSIRFHDDRHPLQTAPFQASGQSNLQSSVPGNLNGAEAALGLSTQNHGINDCGGLASTAPRQTSTMTLRSGNRLDTIHGRVSKRSDSAEALGGSLHKKQTSKDESSSYTAPSAERDDADSNDQSEDDGSSVTSVSSSPSAAKEKHSTDPNPPHFMEQTPFQNGPASTDSVTKRRRDNGSDNRANPRKRTRLPTAPQPSPLLRPWTRSLTRKNPERLTTTQSSPLTDPFTELSINKSTALRPPPETEDSTHRFQSIQIHSQFKHKRPESRENTPPSTPHDSDNPLPMTETTDVGSSSVPPTNCAVPTQSEMEALTVIAK
ncbi:MAG: hypothetical protein Q9182_004201 [Xanthomendoza sp. 2 TL-2023]